MRALVPLFVCLLAGCQKEYEARLPNTQWDLFESSLAVPTDAHSLARLQGVYSVVDGIDHFGPQAVLKWSWTRTGTDTTHHVSIFCERDMAFCIGACKRLDGALLVNMSWRTMANTGTGLCRMRIGGEEGAQALLGISPLGPGDIRIEGWYGIGGDVPDRPFTLVYQRPLPAMNGFQVIGHRCGGRNADLLPVSENSLEMIRMAARLGATAVEMDVRLTSDGVPVIYHDETLNTRAIRPCGLFGPLEDYSYAQLSGIVRLINGERIPTLQEALSTVVHETPLTYVWLDTKMTGSLVPIHALQQELLTQAQFAGRDVRILIGLPEEEQLNDFLALPDHGNIPSLCELGVDDVHLAGSEVWAPRWTLGLQVAEVAQMHQEGRKVFVWTVDLPEYVPQFMQPGSFDGILSNYVPLIAYHAYTRP